MVNPGSGEHGDDQRTVPLRFSPSDAMWMDNLKEGVIDGGVSPS